MSVLPEKEIRAALRDERLQTAIYTATGRLVDKRKAVTDASVLPDYQELRAQANLIKRHTIENLDYYLELFERNLTANGGRLVWCRDGTEVADFILGLAKERGARLIVKSKSMTTEEIDLNERLERHRRDVPPPVALQGEPRALVVADRVHAREDRKSVV